MAVGKRLWWGSFIHFSHCSVCVMEKGDKDKNGRMERCQSNFAKIFKYRWESDTSISITRIEGPETCRKKAPYGTRIDFF